MPDTPRGSGEDSWEKASECEFKFIADPEVRGALQRHCYLSRSTFEMQVYPWTLVFAGRAITTILLDLLDLDRSGALLAPSSGLITNRTLALKPGLDTSRWDSIDLISVAVDRGLVPRDATRLFDPFKGCKNVEGWPNSLEEWKEVAQIAMEVLIALDRKLS